MHFPIMSSTDKSQPKGSKRCNSSNSLRSNHPTKIPKTVTRCSQRLKVNRELQEKLTRNAGKASASALMNLAFQNSIIPDKYGRTRDVSGVYPLDITRNKNCHLRALHNISPDASKMALSLELRAHECVEIQKIAEQYVKPSDGRVFCLRKDNNTDRHWVAVTPTKYFDDGYCLDVINYDGAVSVLECLEWPESVFGGINSGALSQQEAFERSLVGLRSSGDSQLDRKSESNGLRCSGDPQVNGKSDTNDTDKDLQEGNVAKGNGEEEGDRSNSGNDDVGMNQDEGGEKSNSGNEKSDANDNKGDRSNSGNDDGGSSDVTEDLCPVTVKDLTKEQYDSKFLLNTRLIDIIKEAISSFVVDRSVDGVRLIVCGKEVDGWQRKILQDLGPRQEEYVLHLLPKRNNAIEPDSKELPRRSPRKTADSPKTAELDPPASREPDISDTPRRKSPRKSANPPSTSAPDPMVPYHLLKGVTRKGKSFINCLPTPQRLRQKNPGDIRLIDNFTDFHQERLDEINDDSGAIVSTSDGLPLMVPVGDTAKVEEMMFPLAHDKFDWMKFLNFVGLMSSFKRELMKLKSHFPDDSNQSGQMRETGNLDLMCGKLHYSIDFGHGTDLRLSCFSQMSTLILFSPTISRCPRLKQVVESIVGPSDNNEMLIVVHGPKLMEPHEINASILSGKFLQTFDWVCCITFSWSKVDGEMILSVRSNTSTDYKGCGNCKEFLVALAKGYCISLANESMTISMQDSTVTRDGFAWSTAITSSSSASITPFVKSTTAAEMVKDHITRRERVQQPERSWTHCSGLESSLNIVFGTKSLLVDHPEGCQGIRVDAILDNVYLLGKSLWGRKYSNVANGIQWARMSNHVERLCLMAVIIYQLPEGGGYRLACRCCKKDMHIPDHGTYDCLESAMYAAPFTSLIHRLINPFGPGFFERSASDQGTGFSDIHNPPYRLHRDNIHLTDEDKEACTACCPDKLGHDSCLGDDQLILSMLVNDSEGLQKKQSRLWHDIMQSVFYNGNAAEAQRRLEKRLNSLLDGSESVEQLFPETLSEHKTLEDSNDSWNSLEKSLQMGLLHNAKSVMEVDWQHDSFPDYIPEDFASLEKSDRNLLNKLLNDGSNNFKFFHQLGVMFVKEYVDFADSNSPDAKIYRGIPSVAYPFAFECSNGCRNIWNKNGREVPVPSKTYVIRSHVNESSFAEDFRKIIEKDEGCHLSATDEGKLVVDWIAGIGVIGGPHSHISISNGHKQFMNTICHKTWAPLSKTICKALRKYSLEERSQWRRASVSLTVLHPYRAGCYMMKKQANRHLPHDLAECHGLADLQYALSAAFCHGTIPHGKELERMTNACFQGFTGIDANGHEVTRMMTRKVQTKGCAVPNTSSPPGVSGSKALPVKVTADMWNCAFGNAMNLMECLDQYDPDVEKTLSMVQSLRQSDGGSVFGKLKAAIHQARYFIFSLPEGLNYKGLTEYVQRLQLPILVSLSVPHGLDAYDHVVGICPHRDCGNGKINFRIVDGAHPDLKCIEYSSQNLDWCCGVGNQFTVTTDGFAFVPSELRTKKLLEHMQQGGHDHRGTTVCLNIEGKGTIPSHLREVNVVEKEISDYYRILKEVKDCARGK